MWRQIRIELDAGNIATRQWLDGVDFHMWAHAANADTVALRDHLVAAHWQHRAA